MPSKKKKYNARFPPARIKKIMQTDEEVGKVAAAVPVIISRALELFIENLIIKASETTQARNARTLSTSHIKHIIQSEKEFDFLRDKVANIPDIQQSDEDAADLRPVADVSEAPPSAAAAAASASAPASIPPAPAPQPRPKPKASAPEIGPDGQPVKRPRGRPRKVRPEAASEEKLPPKKRGRKKKEQPEEKHNDTAREEVVREDPPSDNETESADEGSGDDTHACASPTNNVAENRLKSPVQNSTAATVTSDPHSDMPAAMRENLPNASDKFPPVPSEVTIEVHKQKGHPYEGDDDAVVSERPAFGASHSDYRVNPALAHHPGLPMLPPHPDGSYPPPPHPMYPHPPGPLPPMTGAYIPHTHPHPHTGAPSALNNSIPPPVPPSYPGHPLPYPPPMSFYGSYTQPSASLPHEHKNSAEPKEYNS